MSDSERQALLNQVDKQALKALFEDDPVDPYPDLEWMDPGQLQDGDVLMMLGMGVYKCLPISDIIRYVDGGAYSHSALVTIQSGKPMIWDHSEDWKLAPVSYEQGVGNHHWAHVYRFHKDGDDVGGDRFPTQPIAKALRAHAGDPYEMKYLILAGIIGVLSNRPKNPVVREGARLLLLVLAYVLSDLIDEGKIKTDMLICTSVTGLSFWEAVNTKPNDYALQVDLDRRRDDESPTDKDWDAAVAAVKNQLQRIYSDFDNQLTRYDQLLHAGNARWVDVGGFDLPANLVSPADLEFSRTLKAVGKLVIPK